MPLGERDFDEVAAGLRDYIVGCGFEPENRDFIAGLFFAKMTAATLLSKIPYQAVFANSVAQAEVCRKWLDGELKTVSIAEMAGFDG